MKTEISSKVSLDADIMQELKFGFDKCQFNDGELHPCAYHKGRAESEIFGIEDGGGCESANISQRNVFKSPIIFSPQISELLVRLGEGASIAGGWWLIKEQRDWLHRHIASILRGKRDECRIMVAGVAGYAHFYSYLRIIINAAKEVGFDCNKLYVDVCDACLTPLMEIAAIENSIRKPRAFVLFPSLRSKYDIMGYQLNLSSRNIKFIREIMPDIKKCHIRIIHCNVVDVPDEWWRLRGRYDVITEHFLLSMMQNLHEFIHATRKAYSLMLKPEGHLLMACGANSQSYIEELIDIHGQHGLSLFENDHQKVWDPFGISLSDLQDMANNMDQASALLDNCMMDLILSSSVNRSL
ncbi:MAG: hypothetical protein IKZ08_05435 [Bacteroidales bacterium]|nr:hypothetical protein [Bacteroidales bacterium]MBR5862754.1 hypothetical protein [Bacteroidales bacterium]